MTPKWCILALTTCCTEEPKNMGARFGTGETADFSVAVAAGTGFRQTSVHRKQAFHHGKFWISFIINLNVSPFHASPFSHCDVWIYTLSCQASPIHESNIIQQCYSCVNHIIQYVHTWNNFETDNTVKCGSQSPKLHAEKKSRRNSRRKWRQ